MRWTDWITLAIAILGALLGILNTYRGFADKRVKLRVVPAWSLADDFSGLGIQVTNLSEFPVTIIEVGLTLDDDKGKLPKRMVIPAGRIVNGDQQPTKLGKLETKSIIFSADGLEKYQIRRAYALTSSGHIARGNSGALKQFVANGNRPMQF